MYVRKTPKGGKPRNWVGTENPLHMQGSSLRWDSNQGPQMLKKGNKALNQPDAHVTWEENPNEENP